jgi:diguanylate cyclase
MSYPANPGQHLRRSLLAFLLAATGGAGLIAAMHLSDPRSQPIDRVMSLGLTVETALLFGYYWLNPERYERVVGIGCAAGLLALVVPSWYYPYRALATGAPMLDSLPPVMPGLLPLILVMIVFFGQRRAFAASVFAWMVVAGPVLGYLLLHPGELRTPRGMDLLVLLGPVSVMLIAFIPFYRAVERWVTALQLERARMQQLAERDGLTGLYNRRASETLLREFLAAPEPTDGLILFDIDRFKAINDRHGHAVGDEVLRQVARRCESLLRGEDVFARWGGEEFLVLVRGTRGDGLLQIAQKLRAAISLTPIEPAGTVTASFGVARIQPFESLPAWLARADAALYEAKETGRDRVATR